MKKPEEKRKVSIFIEGVPRDDIMLGLYARYYRLNEIINYHQLRPDEARFNLHIDMDNVFSLETITDMHDSIDHFSHHLSNYVGFYVYEPNRIISYPRGA